MIELIVALVTALSPIFFIVLLLLAAGWRDRRLEAVAARQIRVTDAIANELGAIVAPVVTKPVGRPWRVEMAVPFGRPSTVARVLALSHRALERMEPGRYEIVLTPQAPVVVAAPTVAATGSRLRVA